MAVESLVGGIGAGTAIQAVTRAALLKGGKSAGPDLQLPGGVEPSSPGQSHMAAHHAFDAEPGCSKPEARDLQWPR